MLQGTDRTYRVFGTKDEIEKFEFLLDTGGQVKAYFPNWQMSHSGGGHEVWVCLNHNKLHRGHDARIDLAAPEEAPGSNP